jgi:hypothetical protein
MCSMSFCSLRYVVLVLTRSPKSAYDVVTLSEGLSSVRAEMQDFDDGNLVSLFLVLPQ